MSQPSESFYPKVCRKETWLPCLHRPPGSPLFTGSSAPMILTSSSYAQLCCLCLNLCKLWLSVCIFAVCVYYCCFCVCVVCGMFGLLLKTFSILVLFLKLFVCSCFLDFFYIFVSSMYLGVIFCCSGG